jgi:hypothetical protein
MKLLVAALSGYMRVTGLISHDPGFSIRISPKSSVSPGLTVNCLRIAGPVSPRMDMESSTNR